MAGQSRVTDVIVGICNHSFPCCPHSVVGVQVSGSPDAKADGKSKSRLGDIGVHS